MRIVLDFSPFLIFGRNAWHASAGEITGPAQASCFNCYIVDDGTLHLQQSGQKWVVRAGEACVVDPGCVASWKADIVLSRFCFDLTPRARYLDDQGKAVTKDWAPQPTWAELFDQQLPETLDTTFLARHRAVIHELCGASLRPYAQLQANVRVAGFVCDLAGQLRGRSQPLPTDDDDPLCRRAESVLGERITTGMTIAELAKLLGCTHEHLARTYKQQRGHTLMHFVRTFRLGKAQRMLARNPAISVQEVAHAVGLKDHRSLDRMFKKLVGCTPREWQRQAQNGA